MMDIPFTSDQRRAIETVDRSVLVSAAAGSGKTAVLAERCAYLVAEAPPPYRCDVDQLLVVTFTEAAASEMRSRIVEALRRRCRSQPNDARLREQMRLADAAQISTIHAFCLWMLRHWFEQAGVDPAAPVLDADEARLLRAQTLDTLFQELYAADDDVGRDFARLVEVYGLGRDDAIARFVLELDDFLSSLPDPEGWLAQAESPSILERHGDDLRIELERQGKFCDRALRRIDRSVRAAAFYAERFEAYLSALTGWRTVLAGSDAPAAFDSVRAEIEAFELSAKTAPRMPREAKDNELAARDQARSLFEDMRETLFKKRLRRRYGLFTWDELRNGLAATAPYVATLAQLARAFRENYDRAKNERAVLDFSDLERRAYDLLTVVPQSAEIRAALRKRFTHVLVDEFQDINPLQAAILSAVSRDAVRTPHASEGAVGEWTSEIPAELCGNFFTVGDVKQSIYRFRLAEPSIFLNRQHEFERGHGGDLVRLQSNFRSRPALLEGVNVLFRRMMRRDLGDIDYDTDAELRPGRFEEAGDNVPIALHLLERRPETTTPDDDESNEERERLVDPFDPVQWSAIQRESYVMGREIQRLIGPSEPSESSSSYRYGDIAILLRAATHSAGPIVAALQALGIPAYAETSSGMLQSMEIRDLLALLNVLDNPQQDIPLASVMRSGVLGLRFNEDDLVEIRALDRAIPFHAAVRRYAKSGPEPRLRERLGDLMYRLERYRNAVRRRPLAEVLWRIYRETGYLSYVVGLINGRQRRANLIKLYDRARQFSGFRNQGLHRFLRFLESLEEDEGDVGVAPAAGDAQNVVRVMSIHKSKGLEFPIVFVADLGRRFNLRDVRGRMIFERDVGIGLRVVDTERMVEYPSLAHTRVAERGIEHSLAEELRVLYVALTRARDRLVLVGSTELSRLEHVRASWNGAEEIDALTRLTAITPLDWLLPALASLPASTVDWDGREPRGCPLFAVREHSEAEMADWRIGTEKAEDTGSRKTTHEAVAQLARLPDDEPRATDSSEADDVFTRLEFVYPRLEITSVRSVLGVTEAKRYHNYLDDPEERSSDFKSQISNFKSPISSPAVQLPRQGGATVPSRPGDTFSAAPRSEPMRLLLESDSPAIRRGRATHLVLQHLDFHHAGGREDVERQMERMIENGALVTEDVDSIDTEAIVWFAGTETAERIRSAGANYHREYMFLAVESPSTFDSALTCEGEERVLLRGVVDGLIVSPEHVELIDFKTDVISPGEVERRAAEYSLQMELYARALERIWRRPVPPHKRQLVFLNPRSIWTAS